MKKRQSRLGLRKVNTTILKPLLPASWSLPFPEKEPIWSDVVE
ncbi:MAG: hypothetical protein WB729_00950 [Candidatus Sulfotelmatobacter sp.]